MNGLRSEEGSQPTLREHVNRVPDDTSVVTAASASSKNTDADHSSGEGIASGMSVEETERTGPSWGASETTTAASGEVGDSRELLPQRLGRYQVVCLLGKGSFGSVYLARDGELDRNVAIKVPTAPALAMPAQLEALLTEARLAAGLRHPAIVGVYDLGRADDGSAFIVLEYVEGNTLSDLLGRGRIEPVRLAELMASVAEAMHHAHRAGLVHRDLKPSNIMIDKQGQPRVTDFGLAITEALQTERAGEVSGTPTHMAPEQVLGEAHRLDGRTDIWALGVILYEGLTGRLPFIARDRQALFDEILHREPKPPRQIDDSIPRELERICLKCLSKRMPERSSSSTDLADDLRAWLVTAGSAAAGTPRPSDVQRPGEAAPTRPAQVVPRGLRAFDKQDAETFLDLLPGPRRARRTARVGLLLEDSNRGPRRRFSLQRRPSLRPLGLREIIADQGRSAPPSRALGRSRIR